MKDYCVEVANNLTDLVNQVKFMIDAGYKPIGGVTVKQRPELRNPRMQWEYYQAMYKETK